MMRDSNDEKLHPGRHSVRLKGYDYSSPGLYFLTICSHEKRRTFGRVDGGLRVELTPLGSIVRECWLQIPDHFRLVSLHEFIVMPNHVHGIVGIGRQAGAQHAAPLRETDIHPRLTQGSIGTMVRSFKAAVARRAKIEIRLDEQVWQRNYFERVIREGPEYADTAAYILTNPNRWLANQENFEFMR